MTAATLNKRIRTAIKAEKGVKLSFEELSRVYIRVRPILGPANEFVEKMRVKVIARKGLTLNKDETRASATALDIDIEEPKDEPEKVEDAA